MFLRQTLTPCLLVVAAAACSSRPVVPPAGEPLAAPSATPQSAVKEATWDFGHVKMPITEGTETPKLFRTKYDRDAKKKKSEYFLKTIYYELDMPVSRMEFSYRIRVSQIAGSGCVTGTPVAHFMLQTGKTRTEVGAGEGAVFKVGASTKSNLLVQIDNRANCDHYDFSLAVSRE